MRMLPSVVATVALSGCAVVHVLTPGASLPERSGLREAVGLDEEVAIYRDAHGVPHVRAGTEADAWYALGYVHAEDRLFQADLSRRFAYGRLSEVIGESTAALDVFMKGLQLRDQATRALSATDPETMGALRAYADGFNAGARSLDPLPVEYRVLGVGFEPWTIEDSAALIFVNSWTLTLNPQVELAALALRDRVDAAGMDDLLRMEDSAPPVDPWWDEVGVDFTIAGLTPGFSRLVGGMVDEPAASNNWVVHGDRTKTGSPILASDPHLSQRVPSLWYLAEIRGGDLHVAGATMPGAPFVTIGHNETLAWGVTNLMADQLDFALVEKAGDGAVRIEGEVVALERRDVRVTVRGGDEVHGEVYTTPLGPVVTSLEGDATHALVMQWHAMHLTDHTADIFYALNRARTVDEGVQATRRDSAVALSAVLGDAEGHIGWAAFGTLVRRKQHTGMVPYPAWLPGHGWDGWLDPIEPVVDPPQGYIHSANHFPHAGDIHAISTRYAGSGRHDRVGEVLAEDEEHSVEAANTLQNDRLDLSARQSIAAIFDGFSADGAAAQRCLELIGDWDGVAEPWSVGAAVWYSFERELLEAALADDLAGDLTMYRRVARPAESFVAGRYDRFVDDKKATVNAALEATCAHLDAELGPDTTSWTWGTLHPLHLTHPFGTASFLMKSWNMAEVPYGGSRDTVNAASYPLRDSMPTGGMASLRIVVPLDDPGSSTAVHPGGQSGSPGSPHFADQYQAFVDGTTLPLWFDDDDVQAAAVDAVVISPSAGVVE